MDLNSLNQPIPFHLKLALERFIMLFSSTTTMMMMMMMMIIIRPITNAKTIVSVMKMLHRILCHR